MLCSTFPMPWHEIEQSVVFTPPALPGLLYLHGDALSYRYNQDRLRNHTYPLVQFPSGVAREITAGHTDLSLVDVHILGQLHLPYQINANTAYHLASELASELDIRVFHNFEDEIIITNSEGNQGHVVLFDNTAPRIADIILTPGWSMELLDGESRAILPPLYSTEHQGLHAIAPIKFFTPDSNWTWYPFEFDGNDLFFGLVSGFEVELGYFIVRRMAA